MSAHAIFQALPYAVGGLIILYVASVVTKQRRSLDEANRELRRLTEEAARSEEALRRAVADRNEVLRIVAHDLRSPLSTIMMEAHILEVPALVTVPRDVPASQVIMRSVTQMNQLIQDLLDVELVEAGKLKVEQARHSEYLPLHHPHVRTMRPMSLARFTYIGGPTALIELAGLRFLTDPTLDPGGTDYPTPAYTLHKTQSPAVAATSLGAIDAVLLSHDHHFDNLDHAGRAALASARTVLTTQAGAERLGGNAVGLAPWESKTLRSTDGHELTVTATPARHGPANGDRGPVVGFVLQSAAAADPVTYISGDTVWYDGVAEVGQRFDVDVAVLNLGAARVAVAGPYDLTFSAEDAVMLARAWPHATILPLHYEGWTHFSQGRAEVSAAFEAAGLSDRIQWPIPGEPTTLG